MRHRDTPARPACAPSGLAALALALASLSAAPACVREHLSPAFGEQTRRTLSLQAVPPRASGDDLLLILDGTSAAQIHENYRKSLATADTSEELGAAPDFGAGK